ncbi:MAG: RNA polymerase sigma factor [Acidobacteriota bacterium]
MEPAVDSSPDEPEYGEILARLERVMGRVCPPWLADQREDLVQLAALKVMEIHRSRGPETELSLSYFWRVAHSVVIDEVRRARRRREAPLESEPGRPQAPSQRPDADPERRARSGQLATEIWDCLGRLVEPRRLAVTLHLQGLAAAESAARLGFKTKKVYNLVHRGLDDLRHCLRQKELAP